MLSDLKWIYRGGEEGCPASLFLGKFGWLYRKLPKHDWSGLTLRQSVTPPPFFLGLPLLMMFIMNFHHKKGGRRYKRKYLGRRDIFFTKGIFAWFMFEVPALLIYLNMRLTSFFKQNETRLLNGNYPEFTDCFQQTLLVWVPCGFLWLSAPFYLYHLLNVDGVTRPHSFLSVAKTVSTCVIFLWFQLGWFNPAVLTSTVSFCFFSVCFIFLKSLLLIADL